MSARVPRRARAAVQALVLACLAVLAAPAGANTLAGALRGSPFQFFTEEDTQQFVATARALVAEEENSPDGKRWANEASGAWGTMAITRKFRRSGAPCREIRGENTARGRTERFRMVVCQTPKGEWKIASSGPAS
jgi:surface antigen